MHPVNAFQNSTGALRCPAVRPRLFKVFSLSASTVSILRKQQFSFRHKQSLPTPRCSAAETGVIESVNQSTGVIPQAAAAETADWDLALQYLKDGSLHDIEIFHVNKGGLIGMLAGLDGFVPFSKVYQTHFGTNVEQHYAERLVREPKFKVKVKVIAVDTDKRRLVLSEVAYIMDAACDRLKPGDEVSVVIRSLVPYGAFANIRDPKTGDLTGGNALLYISDMSWDHVAVPSDIVKIGDEVQCKIKSVDKLQHRISLSLKLMEEDPLRQTLDKLFSPELREKVTEVPVNIPQGVKDICAELEKEDGIESVVLGRQAEERRVVSQDLELWISKEVLPDGFVLITRAGRTVQELKLTTNLPLDGMKSAVQRVLRRLS